MSDTTLQGALVTLLTALFVAYGLWLMMLRLRRRRPGLTIAVPLAIGFAARLVAVVAVDGTGLSSALRGGDESTFLIHAHPLAALPFSSAEWFTKITTELHVSVFAGQMRILDATPTSMRMVQIGIAMAGLLLLVAAVYELAGARSARLAAWILMLEPASIFFNSALHKEPLMLLASGAGRVRRHAGVEAPRPARGRPPGARRRDRRQHAAVRGVVSRQRLRPAAPARRVPAAGPSAARDARHLRGAPDRLPRLPDAHRHLLARQPREAAGSPRTPPPTRSRAAQSTGPNGNNLALEHVDFSSRGKVATNLPKRALDVLTKPYPWQVANPSQVLGAVGSVAALSGLFMLLGYAWRARGRILESTGPLLYPLLFLLMAYSLSAGNAGTGFRYRTHIVTLSLAMLLILRSIALERRAPAAPVRAAAPERRPPIASPVA